MEYEQRMEVLDKLEYPKPLRDWTYDLFDAYRVRHPWAADHNIRPKSVARDLYERAMTFSEYVAHYGLARSEGLVLRYLSDAYKGLVRTVPEDVKTDELVDLTEWLGELVRQVDSSLLDEWEALAAAAEADPAALDEAVQAAQRRLGTQAPPPPVTANDRAFRVMVRNAAFRRVELAARGDIGGLVGAESTGGWDRAAWPRPWPPTPPSTSGPRSAPGPTPGAGRGSRSRSAPHHWGVRQVIDDPEGDHDWALTAEIDLAASDAEGAPAWRTTSLGTTPTP